MLKFVYTGLILSLFVGSYAASGNVSSKKKVLPVKKINKSLNRDKVTNYKFGKSNFKEAAEAAINRGVGFAKGKSDYQSARYRQVQSQLAFLPSAYIELSKSNTDLDYTHERSQYGIRNQREKSSQVQGVISQNLFHGFYTINNTKAMKDYSDAAKWKLENERQNIIYNALEAVCRLWYTKEKFKYAKMKEENLHKALIAEKDKLSAGVSTKYDVSKAKADYAEAIYFADEAKFELLAAQAEFKKVTTLDPLNEVELPNLEIEVPENVNKLKLIAFEANPAIMEAKYAQKAADHYVNAVIGKLGPRVDLKVSVGRYLNSYNDALNGSPIERRNKNSRSIALSATIPIFENGESGNTYSEIALAREAAKKSAFEVKDQQNTVEKDCVTSFEQYKTSLTLINSATQAVNSAEVGVEGERQESELGLKSLTETLVREKQLCDLRISLAEAKYKLVLAKGKMMQSMGKLSLQNLYKQPKKTSHNFDSKKRI